MNIFIDFETRSRLPDGVKGAGAVKYSKNCEVLCCAVAIDDAPSTILNIADLPALLGKAEKIIAHNVFFEYCIIKNTLGVDVPIEKLYCTAALARSAGLPGGLEKCATALGFEAGKDQIGRAAMLKLCKPTGKAQKFIERAARPELYEQLEKYCMIDVELSREIWKRLQEFLPAFERRLWEIDLSTNLRGVAVDRKALAYLQEQNAIFSKYVESQSTLNLRSTKQLREATGFETFAKPALAALLSNDDLSPETRALFELRQAASKSSTAKLERIEARLDNDGRVKDNLIFNGAGPGRWTATGVQLQNLPRPVFDHEEIEGVLQSRPDLAEKYGLKTGDFLASAIRSLFVAGLGKNLIVGDFASIEARLLVYLAGDRAALKEYRDGVDRYVRMAAAIFRTEQIDKEKRQLGKMAVLGCGYGMGSRKFADTCRNSGLAITDALAQKSVEAYRRVNSRTVKFWYDCEKAFRSAMFNRGSVQKAGPILFKAGKEYLQIKLLSGRKLTYWHPRATNDGLSYRNSKGFEDWTYGGKIVENIVQATARDVMADRMLALTDAGFEIVLTVHDEVWCEGRQDLKKFDTILSGLPAWLSDYPQGIESYRAKRYRK
jgi:DNA polymerase